VKTGSKLRRNPSGAVSGISSRTGKLVPDLMAGVNPLVAEQRASACTPLGIEEIHHARTDHDPGKKLALACH
jgi:hypothetical protein